jgi:hypothetical protein
VTFDDHGFAWSEATTAAQLAGGERVFARGRKLEPAVERRQIETPKGLMFAWVDPDNQDHWTPDQYSAPDGWRPLYIAKEEW